MKKTSLHQQHLNLSAKMIEYAGYHMPIYYSDISQEHHAVRNEMGIFDVSHMGEIIIVGPEAIQFTNMIITNHIDHDYQKVTYSVMCKEDGGIVDDLLCYVFDPSTVLFVVNASNLEKDYTWILKQSQGYDVKVMDVSLSYSQIALQGPKVIEHIEKIVDEPVKDLPFMRYVLKFHNDQPMIISRTGYTGEDGFEVYADHQTIETFWLKAIELGFTPCGLGARDTLRFEANLPLYGHEIDETIHPYEAGLGFCVKLEKEFIGKKEIEHKKEHLERKIVGIELLEKGIPRQGYEVLDFDLNVVGFITTGYLSPTLEKPIAFAMVSAEVSKLNTELFVKVRKNNIPAKVVSRKFLKKNYKK